MGWLMTGVLTNRQWAVLAPLIEAIIWRCTIAFSLAPGQAHELLQAVGLFARLPGGPRWVVADRDYTSHAFREHIWNLGARPVIPPQRYWESFVHCNGQKMGINTVAITATIIESGRPRRQ